MKEQHILIRMIKKRSELEQQKYLYCTTCKEFFDMHVYDSLEDAGHDTCKVRKLSGEEIKNCELDCKEFNCEEW